MLNPNLNHLPKVVNGFPNNEIILEEIRMSVTRLNVSTTTRVAYNVSSQTLVSGSTARRNLIVQNEGSAIMYILYGSSAASATSYTVALNPGEILIEDTFYGQMNYLFSNSNGVAQLTTIGI